MEKYTDVEALSKYITDEMFKLMKFSPQGWVRKTFGPLLSLPAHRFAQVAGTFDHYVEEYGFREAALRILPVFIQGFEACNVENVPKEGPLLITSNHPGTCDSLVIAANIPRPDLKIVATGIPFMRGIQHAAHNLIYSSADIHERMMVVRNAIRHLENGGAVLIFPTGHIDPDPQISDQAANELNNWSPSLEVMLRHVPQTRVLLSIVSGVLSERWRNLPFIRLAGRDDLRQRGAAEILQVIWQMIFPNSVHMTPRLTFSNPLTTDELRSFGQDMLDGMIDRARCLLEDHMAEVQKLLAAGT